MLEKRQGVAHWVCGCLQALTQTQRVSDARLRAQEYMLDSDVTNVDAEITDEARA